MAGLNGIAKIVTAFGAGSALTYFFINGEKNPLKPTSLNAARASLPENQDEVDGRPNQAYTAIGRPNEIMKYGFPSNTNLKIRQNYIVSYDPRNRVPHWVFEHINKDLISNNDPEVQRQDNFKEDDSIHKYFRSTNRDYYHSGFDRGHMAAAANQRLYQSWMNESFYLSNIAPQDPQFNRNIWNNLEKYVRSLAHHNDNVYICTGPLYLPIIEGNRNFVKYQVIGDNHIAVPTHFFKVVVTEKNNQFELRSYIFPNKPEDANRRLREFYCPLEVIERNAGFVLFDRIPKDRFRRINDERNRTF